MHTFLELEAGNFTIALFFIMIVIIVATRSFVGGRFKKGLFVVVIAFFTVMIAGHYLLTSQRMYGVQKAFDAGKEIVCENRMHRKASQGLVLSKALSWRLEQDIFVNDAYSRGFHSARCIVKVIPLIDLKK